MHKTVLSLGRTFDKQPSGHLGSRPRAGALLVAGLIASGVVQLPSSAVAAPALRSQDPSVTERGVQVSVASSTPARSSKAFLPRLFVGDDKVFEGDDARFELFLSKSSRRSVTVRFFTQDGTAKGDSDYEEVSGSRTFRPGSKFAWVFVETFKDRRKERDETFFLRVFQVRGANLGDSFGRATIFDRTRNDPKCHPRCDDPPKCHPRCDDPPKCQPRCDPPPCHPRCDPPGPPNPPGPPPGPPDPPGPPPGPPDPPPGPPEPPPGPPDPPPGPPDPPPAPLT